MSCQKKLITVTFLCLIIGIYGCGYFALKGAERYYSLFHKYSIVVPKGWKSAELKLGNILTAISPFDSAKDTFRENYNVTVAKLPPGIKFENYMRVTIQQQSEGSQFDFYFYESGAEIINGSRALWNRYAFTAQDLKLQAISYLLMRGEDVYMLTFIAQREKFPQYEALFKLIARSFRFET